jgi:hypothetical protein
MHASHRSLIWVFELGAIAMLFAARIVLDWLF